jgi:hypothetical protein
MLTATECRQRAGAQAFPCARQAPQTPARLRMYPQAGAPTPSAPANREGLATQPDWPTQEFLAPMVGVRGPSVTLVAAYGPNIRSRC